MTSLSVSDVFRYPKQQRLLQLKKASVNNSTIPPSFLSFDDLSSLHPCKFDVILIDPPFSSSFTWDHLQDLPVPNLAADPSFVFLWVGSGAGEGLERGREVLAKWGYRRCEDVVWVKTNKSSNLGPGVRNLLHNMDSTLIFFTSDGSPNNVTIYENQAALSHRHTRNGSPLNR